MTVSVRLDRVQCPDVISIGRVKLESGYNSKSGSIPMTISHNGRKEEVWGEGRGGLVVERYRTRSNPTQTLFTVGREVKGASEGKNTVPDRKPDGIPISL
jgi:hypothetical protein